MHLQNLKEKLAGSLQKVNAIKKKIVKVSTLERKQM